MRWNTVQKVGHRSQCICTAQFLLSSEKTSRIAPWARSLLYPKVLSQAANRCASLKALFDGLLNLVGLALIPGICAVFLKLAYIYRDL